MSDKKKKKTDGLFDTEVLDTETPIEPHYEQPHVKDFDGASYEPEEDRAADAGADVGTMEDVEAVMRKYDKESNTRIWEGKPKFVIDVLMALFSLYCIWSTLYSNWGIEKRLTLFMGCMIILGFITYPITKKHVKVNSLPWYDIVIMVLGAGAFLYYCFTYDAFVIEVKSASSMTSFYSIVGLIGVLSVVELCRRCVGLPILFVAGALVIYTFVSGINFDRFIYTLFYSVNGILSTPINVCAKFIVVFVIFGSFLERTGIANFFIECANFVAGSASGGPAKVAVIASALEGMASGSSVANTVGSGSITIPMMKKTGYRAEFAAAVEASASTGGQIMPPIMGAAAFLMAEFLGVSYAEVATRAILPAVLYFLGIFIAVHLEAKRSGLKGIPRSELPKFGALIKDIYLLAPIVVLVVMVSTNTKTIQFSAAISIVVAIVASLFKSETRITPRKFMDALAAGARGSITVAVACAVAGIISGCINVTGLGMTLIGTVVRLSGGIPMIGLILTMLCCIVLGMGVPTTANYIIMASTCAPILINGMNMHILAANMFVFYFGIVADITPPVALAAYAGAAIAKAPPMKTALNATRLAIAAFIIPYIFAYNNAMIFVGDVTFFGVASIVISATLGMASIASGFMGYLIHDLKWYSRIALIAGGLLMVIPGTVTDLAGLAILIVILLIQRAENKKEKKAAV